MNDLFRLLACSSPLLLAASLLSSVPADALVQAMDGGGSRASASTDMTVAVTAIRKDVFVIGTSTGAGQLSVTGVGPLGQEFAVTVQVPAALPPIGTARELADALNDLAAFNSKYRANPVKNGAAGAKVTLTALNPAQFLVPRLSVVENVPGQAIFGK